jgi:hypothetical protein
MVENNEFKTGKREESDDSFNERIADNLDLLEKFIEINFRKRRRFEKRIFFRYLKKENKRKENDSQIQNAELRHDFRTLFVYDSKRTLDSVCRKNFNEFLNLEEAYMAGEPYDFKHFIQYSLKEEEFAQEGFEYRSAVGYRLKARAGSDNENDEMHVRFIIPEGLILDESTPEEEVQDWFEDIKEVYIEYDRKTDLGFQAEIYRVSQEGLQKYPIIDQVENLNILTDYQKIQSAEKVEIDKLRFLYSMLADMELVPINSTHIEV